MFKNGIITKATHNYCVRLSPALVINKDEIDETHEIIVKSLRELEQLNAQRS